MPLPHIVNVEIDHLLLQRGWYLQNDADYHHRSGHRGERIRIRDDNAEKHIGWVHFDAEFMPLAHGRYGRDIREYIRDELSA